MKEQPGEFLGEINVHSGNDGESWKVVITRSSLPNLSPTLFLD